MQQPHSFPSELTICTVGELRAQWLSWLAAAREADDAEAVHDQPLQVNAAAVNEVDAAGVQLVLALSHSLARERRRLHIENPSLAFSSACELLGVSALLTGTEASESAA